jgi:hypothetical protein
MWYSAGVSPASLAGGVALLVVIYDRTGTFFRAQVADRVPLPLARWRCPS